MSEIKKIKHGLDKVQASVVDVDTSSLFDFFIPKQLRAGKNEIKLRLVSDNVLIKGSEVLIDILDSEGNPLFYEVSEIANEDKTRSIIVHIFESDVSGPCKFYLYSKLSSVSTYLCILNLEINSELETQQEIKLQEPPVVTYTEQRLETQQFNNQLRQTNINGSGTVSSQTSLVPRQQVQSAFVVEKSEVRNLESRTQISNNVGSGSTIQLPYYFESSILTSDGFYFSSSYRGGTIYVNGINLDIPSDAINSSEFTNQSFSASIIDVPTTSSLKIYPGFNYKLEYQTASGKNVKVYDKFLNQQNFTCSVFQPLSISKTDYTQSYAVFDFENLNTVAGKIDSVDISYKNLSLLSSNYEPLGNFKVRSSNILIDSASLIFDNDHGILNTQIGKFDNLGTFEQYWQTSSQVPVLFSDGIFLQGSNLVIEPRQNYKPDTTSDSEFELEIKYKTRPSSSYGPQIDVFISGSDIVKLRNTKRLIYPILNSGSLGTYIGSLTDRAATAKLYFKTLRSSKITPKFLIRQGYFTLSSVILKPKENIGYNVNQTRIHAPLTLPTGSEVNFKIDYVNPVGKKLSTFSTVLQNVYFQGSFKPVSGSSGGSVTLPPGLVSGSDQLTGSYDQRYERKGTGILSSSNQISTEISGAFFQPSSSFSTRITNLESVSGSWVGTGSYQQDSGSWNDRLAKIELTTGSLNQYTGSNNTRLNIIELTTGSLNLFSGSANTRLANLEVFTSSINNYTGSNNIRLNLIEQATGSLNQFTGSASNRFNLIENKTGSYATTGSNQFNGNQSVSGTLIVSNSIQAHDFSGIFNGVPSSSQQIKNLLPTGTASGSEQFTSSYDVRYEIRGNNIVSSSNQVKNFLPSGTVSGSEQLTGSYDQRYELRGSNIVSSSQQVKNFLPSGVASGSEQFTGSYDVRYHRLGTGIYSSSNQVDYNQIQNKIEILTPGQYRILTSTGNVSSSRANDRVEYLSGSNINRFRLRNEAEFEQGYSSSYWTTQWTFVSQSSHSVWNASFLVSTYIPLFKTNDYLAPITSSNTIAYYAVEVKNHVLGITGSLSSPFNTYGWSMTSQYKVLVSPIDATPISSVTAVSSSMFNSLGGYGGTYPGKTDLSTWLTFSAAAVSTGNNLRHTISLRPTSSFAWTIYVATVATITKHEIGIV